MKRISTVDNMELEFREAGPNILLWLKGPKGGFYGSCILDLQDMKDIRTILKNHIERVTATK